MLLQLKYLTCVLILTGILLPFGLFSQDRGGDQIISFPIKLERKGAFQPYFISFFYQRNDKIDYVNRGWNDNFFIGPEPRIVYNGNLDSAETEPDALIVDFFFADKDHLIDLTNIQHDEWNNYPQEDGSFKKGKPALIIFGSGGFKVGYDFEDKLITVKDSAYYNIWDDGYDFWFNYMAMPLPKDLWAANRNELYLRVRFRIYAKNHGIKGKTIADDKDNFYIDRIKIERFGTQIANNEIVALKAGFKIPFTVIPYEQATRIPVFATIVNNSGYYARNCKFTLSIKHSSVEDKWPVIRDNFDIDYYCKRIELGVINPFEKVDLDFPVFNAANDSEFLKVKGGKYEARLITQIDFYSDTTYSTMQLDFGDFYAYDQFKNPVNDIPEFSGIFKHGLSLPAYSDGTGSFISAFGNYIDGHKGSIAVKFNLNVKDTIFGFMGYFSGSAPEAIRYRIYYNSENNLPGEEVSGSIEDALEGFDEITGKFKPDEYSVSFMENPLMLEPGTYWMAIEQLGNTSLFLGGSKYRAGMRTVNYSDGGAEGDKGNCVFIHKEFRQMDNEGNYKNSNLFAYNNFDNRGWVSFTPSEGDPAYAHLDNSGLSPYDSLSKTFSRGTFIPMIRPYFGYSHLVSVDNTNEPSNDLQVISYPNPCKGNLFIKFVLVKPGRVKLSISDTEGRAVTEIVERFYDSGTHILKFNMGVNSDGIYYYSLSFADKYVTGKVVLIK